MFIHYLSQSIGGNVCELALDAHTMGQAAS